MTQLQSQISADSLTRSRTVVGSNPIGNSKFRRVAHGCNCNIYVHACIRQFLTLYNLAPTHYFSLMAVPCIIHMSQLVLKHLSPKKKNKIKNNKLRRLRKFMPRFVEFCLAYLTAGIKPLNSLATFFRLLALEINLRHLQRSTKYVNNKEVFEIKPKVS